MKIIETKELKQALSTLSKVSKGITTMSVTNIGLTLTVDDLLTRLSVDISGSSEDKRKDYIIDFKELNSFVKNIKTPIVVFSFSDDSVIVSSNGVTKNIDKLNSAFPYCPTFQASGYPCSAEVFSAIHEAMAWIDKDVSRHTFRGVFIEENGITASDGAALYHRDIYTGTTAILPWSKVWEGKPKYKKDGSITNNELFIWLQSGPWSLITKTIQGTYPDYRLITPKPYFILEFNIPEESLKILLKMLPLIPEDKILLSCQNDLLICANSTKLRVPVQILNNKTPFFGKAINPKYLIQALKQNFTKICIKGPEISSPIMLKGKDKYALIMPMR